MRKLLKFITSKTFIIGILFLFQLGLFFGLINLLSTDYFYAQIAFRILSFLISIYIIGSDLHPMYKMSWLIPILLFPVFGGMFYLFYYLRNIPLKQQKRFSNIIKRRSEITFDYLKYEDDSTKLLSNFNWYPYENTKTTFISSGQEKLSMLLEDLNKAQKYIFIEFFIISKSDMFNSIYNVLIEKLQNNIEVTILYDDFGSAQKLPKKKMKQLISLGAKIIPFNPMKVQLNFALNYRNHRKIVVIDGKIGYTGGINIGDEYTNTTNPYGYWRDAAIKLEGQAVWGLLLSTLTTIHFQAGNIDFKKYYVDYKVKSDGIVAPFDDIPHTNGRVTKDLLIQLIISAKSRVWLTTPYLILDNEMVNALEIAKKKGIDVKIIIPSIPDKRLVYMVSESYMADLVKNNIEVYKFSPGFIHSKLTLIDDDMALIGTSNLDFRSLYLHFENNVYLKGTSSISVMNKYFTDTLKVSKLVTKDDLKKRNFIYRLIQSFLKGFSPML